MSASAGTLPAAPPAPAPLPGSGSGRWLFGPLPDLVLGCGVGYAVLFVVQALDGDAMRAFLPQAFAPLFALVTATPHYGATLLRVYARPEDRQRYRFFTVHLTLLVVLLFVAGIHLPLLGSWILTLYLTWSPWHYTGQNYGLAVLFLRRRGVDPTPRAKRWLYASFLLSFVLTFLAVHGDAYSGGSYAPESYRAPEGSVAGPVYRFLPLGIPGAVVSPLLGLGFGAYLVATIGAATSLLRVGRPRDLFPSAVLVLTQSLWFSVPVVVQHWGLLRSVEPLDVEFSRYAFLWVIVGHSVQYLWVTAYFARSQPGHTGFGSWFLRCVAFGAAAWGVPALVFGSQALGGPEYAGGLYLLIGACVNLHHFLLDGAIWKLRDGRVARILIRPVAATVARPDAGIGPAPERRGWIQPALLAAGAVCAAITVVATLEIEYGWTRALERRDTARMAAASERLRLLGRPNSQIELDLASVAAERGDFESALQHLERSVEVRPLPKAFYLRGLIHERRGAWSLALESLESARALTPDRPEIHEALARVRAAAAGAGASDASDAGGRAADRS